MSAASDPNAEAEVDLGRYGRALVERWWLVAAGLVAGAVIGYLLSLGGGRDWRAQAVVYQGQPLGILGNSPVQSLNTNPSTAGAIVKSESAIKEVSSKAGMRPGQLRSGTSVTAIQGSIAKLGQTPLVQIGVKGPQPAKVRDAANAFADILVSRLSSYTDTKIATQTKQLDQDRNAVAAINAALSQPNVSLTNRLLLQLRLTSLQQDVTQMTQLLALARNVEAPRVVTHAEARLSTARSRRNSTLVGGLIGVILGGIAALLWEPVVARRRPG